jgi:pyruvate formate-lyase activating enzyme-like uncharacterized protein
VAELQQEDAQRMRRLSEEVRSRLLELALITGRTVGMEIPKTGNIRFVPGKKTKAMDASSGDWVEIIEVDVNGRTVEACYGEKDGKPFAESPCGA